MDPDMSLLLDVLEAVQVGAENDRDESVRRVVTDILNTAISALNDADVSPIEILDALESALTAAAATLQASSSLGGKATTKKVVSFAGGAGGDRGRARSRSTSPSRRQKRPCFWRVRGRTCPKGQDCPFSHDDKEVKDYKAAMGKDPNLKGTYDAWVKRVDERKEAKANSAASSSGKAKASSSVGRVTLGSFAAVVRDLRAQ
jgi:hypothetical protein